MFKNIKCIRKSRKKKYIAVNELISTMEQVLNGDMQIEQVDFQMEELNVVIRKLFKKQEEENQNHLMDVNTTLKSIIEMDKLREVIMMLLRV